MRWNNTLVFIFFTFLGLQQFFSPYLIHLDGLGLPVLPSLIIAMTLSYFVFQQGARANVIIPITAPTERVTQAPHFRISPPRRP